MWRSLVARMVRDHEAASSNLAIPTRKQRVRLNAGPFFCFLVGSSGFRVPSGKTESAPVVQPPSPARHSLCDDGSALPCLLTPGSWFSLSPIPYPLSLISYLLSLQHFSTSALQHLLPSPYFLILTSCRRIHL